MTHIEPVSLEARKLYWTAGLAMVNSLAEALQNEFAPSETLTVPEVLLLLHSVAELTQEKLDSL